MSGLVAERAMQTAERTRDRRIESRGEVNVPETQRQTEDTGRIRSIKWDKYSKGI